jgi:acid phosphatase
VNTKFCLQCFAILFILSGCLPSNYVNHGKSHLQQVVPQAIKQTVNRLSNKLPVKKIDHVVVVVEENHSYSGIVGNPDAPYINSLIRQGANFTDYHAIEHPSQPNYLDLFSGSNQGVTDDSCPHTFNAPNLASELIKAKLTFGGYSEDLPKVGFTGCSSSGNSLWPWSEKYARKHSPWVNFTNIPSDVNLPFTSFPKDYSQLPTVSFVIPNLDHDMHDGSIKDADMWLREKLDPYVQWAKTHNSLLIVTWDEDDQSQNNKIPTFFVGPMVRPGTYNETVNHFNLLRTIEDLYGLPHAGRSESVRPITDVWN